MHPVVPIEAGPARLAAPAQPQWPGLMGADYWQPLANLLRDPLLAQGTIDRSDLSRLLITDDPVAAAAAIRDQGVRRFGLRLAAPVRPRWYLGESPPRRSGR
jgi:predicted Rossmann-fold nucleotide-binding protein